MAKRRKGTEKQGIDCIPVCCFQRPRSPPRKRRTDFSPFCCSYNSPAIQQVSLLEYSSGKDSLATTSADSDKRMDMEHVMPKSSVLQCRDSENGEREDVISSDSDDGLVVENTPSGPSNESYSDEQKGDTAKLLECTPIKSDVTDCSDVFKAVGSVVWAKTAGQIWWPAEIIRQGPPLCNSIIRDADGCVLVQYYGKQESAWIDVRDLSRFEECFEERSCDPMEDFQVALKQALGRKEQMGSCRQLFGTPDAQNNSSFPEKLNSSSSSKTEGDNLMKGRGKRKRKPNARFDEVAFPLKSTRKLRRYRIMRLLGLAAPIGSPF